MIGLFKIGKKMLCVALASVMVVMSLFTNCNLTASANIAELNCANRNTIYWDGGESAVVDGSGTKTDPYIIKTADELAWLVKQNADTTKGKYFEIDKSIGTIVLQLKSYAKTLLLLRTQPQ